MKTLNPIIKTILWFTFLALLLWLFTGCSKEPYGYDNFYIKFQNNSQDQLEFTTNQNEGWQEIENCVDYCISFETWTDNGGIPRYRLEYAGSYEYTNFYFTGHNNIVRNGKGEVVRDHTMEIKPLNQTAFSLIIEGPLLKQTEYELSLSYPKNW